MLAIICLAACQDIQNKDTTVCWFYSPLFAQRKCIQWLKQEGDSLLIPTNFKRTVILKQKNKNKPKNNFMDCVKRLHAHPS